MLLVVDIGNTQTAIGLFDEDVLFANFTITTQSSNTSDEIFAMLHVHFSYLNCKFDCIENVIISSVVPMLTDAWTSVAKRISKKDGMIVNASLKCGINLDYVNKHQVGADRIADAVAAIKLKGAPVIVVDLGTATNIEVIDSKGVFCGGIICPGMRTSANALFSSAAQVTQTVLEYPKRILGTSTQEAVQSGLIFGEIVRIDGLVKLIFKELGYKAPVIATGGMARYISEGSHTIEEVVPDLTLYGLKEIFYMNKTTNLING